MFDLQAASIWHDMSAVLPGLQGTVADIACGAQPYRRLLTNAAAYVGVDRGDLRETFGYEAPDTLLFDGDRWPLDDAAVDAVLSTETLEHVPDPEVFLREAYRCLKPGGKMVLTVPFAARWHFVPHDYWRFTPSALELLLRRVGFDGIRVLGRGNALTVAAYKLMALPLASLAHPDQAMGLRALKALTFAPAMGLLAAIGHWSLRHGAGHDCLGLTALATRP